jgi:hypothetical protein
MRFQRRLAFAAAVAAVGVLAGPALAETVAAPVAVSAEPTFTG